MNTKEPAMRSEEQKLPGTTSALAFALAIDIKDAIDELADGVLYPDLIESVDRLAALARAPDAGEAEAALPPLYRVHADRSYDQRAKAIIAFNTCKGDLDDKLEAAWLAALTGKADVPARIDWQAEYHRAEEVLTGIRTAMNASGRWPLGSDLVESIRDLLSPTPSDNRQQYAKEGESAPELTDDQIDGILHANGWIHGVNDRRKAQVRNSFRRTLNDAARCAAPSHPPATPAVAVQAEPVFHLRGYGDVTEAEMLRLAAAHPKPAAPATADEAVSDAEIAKAWDDTHHREHRPQGQGATP